MQRWIAIGLIALIFLCTTVLAGEVYLEKSDGQSFISLNSDQNTIPGSFFVQMNYSHEVSVKSIEGNPPFSVFSDIQNEDGYTNLAGIAMEKAEPDINFRLAEIVFEGETQFEIIVWELFDYDLNPIKVTNICPEENNETKEAPLDEYHKEPRYEPIKQTGSTKHSGSSGSYEQSYSTISVENGTGISILDQEITEDCETAVSLGEDKNESENNLLYSQSVTEFPVKIVQTEPSSQKTSTLCNYSVLLSLLFAMFFLSRRRR